MLDTADIDFENADWKRLETAEKILSAIAEYYGYRITWIPADACEWKVASDLSGPDIKIFVLPVQAQIIEFGPVRVKFRGAVYSEGRMFFACVPS